MHAAKIVRMTSRLRALILLAALLWQSLGALEGFNISLRAAEFEHVTLHVQDASHLQHHHPADQLLHMDADETNLQHFHADVGSGGMGLLASAWPNPLDSNALRLPDTPASLWLSPTLEGPLRPPRYIA